MAGSRKILLNLVRMAVGLAMLWYVLSITEDWGGTRNVMERPLLVLGFLLLPFIGAAIESLRMGLLFHAYGLHLSFLNGYRVVAIGTLFSFVIPGGTGGDVTKLYYLATENRGHTMEIATILVIDRVVALFSLLILILLLALADLPVVMAVKPVQTLIVIAALGMLALLLFMAVSFSPALRAWPPYCGLIQRYRWGHYLDRVFVALYSFRGHKPALLYAALLSMVGHAALTGMFAALSLVLMPGMAVLSTVLFSLLGMLANALPVTPGGIGVGEAAFEWLFGLLGHSGGAQLILAWRIGILPICVLGGALYMIGRRNVDTAFSRSS